MHYNRLKRVRQAKTMTKTSKDKKKSETMKGQMENSQVVQLSTASIKSLSKRSFSISGSGTCISSHWHWLFLLLVLLLVFLLLAAYSYITCDLSPGAEEGQYRLLDIQYASLPDSLKGKEENIQSGENEENAEEKVKKTGYVGPASYFPARVFQNQNSSETEIKMLRKNLLRGSKASGGSKISRAEVLTRDCLWPLVALVTAVLALILFVLALLVIIANCLK